MLGIQAYHYRRYEIEKAEQAGIEKAYQELKQKPLEVIERYKTLVMDKMWKNRSLIAKIWKFPYVPVRFIAVERILNETKE